MGVAQPLAESGHVLTQTERLDHLELEPEAYEIAGRPIEAIEAELNPGLVAFGGEDSYLWGDEAGDLVRRRVDEDDGPMGVASRGDPFGHHPGRVGERAGDEDMPDHFQVRNPVHPEGPPIGPLEVVGDEVPASVGGHEPVRLDTAPAVATILGLVGEDRPLAVVTCLRQFYETFRGDKFAGRHERHGGGPQSRQLCPQARREEAVELGEGGERPSFDARHRGRRRDAEHDCHRHRLVVVEQEGRDVTATSEAVAAAGPRRAFYLIAEKAQPVHIASDGPRIYLQTFGQIVSAPGGTPLQET